MPNSEYFAAGGGPLKLKGSSGIQKKKKKNKHKAKSSESTDPATTAASAQDPPAEQAATAEQQPDKATDVQSPPAGEEGDAPDQETLKEWARTRGMTQAERNFEERRRKRELERLKREKPKTHAENVQDFNRKLASLSEHHDMPRIGPG